MSIDFIVATVNPTKDDKVLDPACGTAGFLVSAYKHILEQHDGKNPDGSKNDEKPLTPDQRKAIMNNFEGYDVDPGMVRISQVNMYLHRFRNPKIYNYNTLSQDERWADKFDVILANPPFMSPKGGVSTHNKFSVQSSRSEVLFVDYIMNHLRPKGRAGIIVPEGIIFQSGTAHKQLRKNLVEDGLYAVVSLSSGVFQPYSGVKTSILLFNNELAKRNNEILFVKVENDGFDPGATKRPINKNDLPQALEIINAWKDGKKLENKLAVYIEKTKIAESGDYNLSGDRYRTVTDYSNAKWPMVEFGEVCKLGRGFAFKSTDYVEKGILNFRVTNIGDTGLPDLTNSVYLPNDFLGVYKEYQLQEGDFVIVMVGANTGKIGLITKDVLPALLNQNMWRFFPDQKKLSKRYLYYLIHDLPILPQGGAQGYLKQSDFKTIKIPLPPLEIQEQIVAELDGYQNVLSGARQVVENWKPKIDIDPEWEIKKVGDISERVTKGTTPTTAGFNYQDSGINFIKIESITDTGDFIPEKFAHIDKKCHETLERSQLKLNDVLFSIAGALGRVALVKEDVLPANINQALAIISPKDEINPSFLEQVLRSDLIQNQLGGLKVGVAQSNLSLAQVSNFEIPLPPLDVQKQIVKKIEAERALIESAKKLIEIYEQKAKDVLSKLWAE